MLQARQHKRLSIDPSHLSDDQGTPFRFLAESHISTRGRSTRLLPPSRPDLWKDAGVAISFDLPPLIDAQLLREPGDFGPVCGASH